MRFPQAHLEILGYKHIVALAERAFYADAMRSIEYGPLASSSRETRSLPPELVDYFASFDLILSYLFDPDEIFATICERCGVRNAYCGPAETRAATNMRRVNSPDRSNSSAYTWSDPAAEFIQRRRSRVRRNFLASLQHRSALHPGSGSETKNWPIENGELANYDRGSDAAGAPACGPLKGNDSVVSCVLIVAARAD